MKGKLFSSVAAIAFMGLSTPAHSSTMYISDSFGQLGTVDTTSGLVSVIGSFGQILTDIAFDPNGNLFGISFSNLFSIDVETGSTTLIGAHGVAGGNGLVFGSDGTLYAAGYSTSNLYSLDVDTGTGTSLGDMGFSSSGDLAFLDGDMYLSGSRGNLVSIDLSDLAASSVVGTFGVSSVYGIATDDASSMYAVAGTSVYSVDTVTGAASDGVSYAGQGLGTAYGQSFFAEAGANPIDDPSIAPVPLPAGLPLLLTALLGTRFVVRRKKCSAA